jgi:hypothetical protein
MAHSNIVRARVTVCGTRPLLQHAFGPDAIPLEKGEKTGVAGNDPEEWKRTLLVTAEGQLYVRDDYVFGCLRDGAKHTKSGKGSIQPKVAATLIVEDSVILLNRWMPKDGPKRNDFAAPVYIDVRGVKNPSTKGRNVRYRLACSAGWECSFTIAFDKTIVAREQMKAVLRDASVLVGLADGRSIGMGRFEVLSWEEIGNAEETPAEGSVGPATEDRVEPRRKKVRPVQEAAASGDGEH